MEVAPGKNTLFWTPLDEIWAVRKALHYKSENETYELDVIANEKGTTLIRLSPYHYQYNAIELIWTQVKGGLWIDVLIVNNSDNFSIYLHLNFHFEILKKA